jgi:hypothetical protein
MWEAVQKVNYGKPYRISTHTHAAKIKHSTTSTARMRLIHRSGMGGGVF